MMKKTITLLLAAALSMGLAAVSAGAFAADAPAKKAASSKSAASKTSKSPVKPDAHSMKDSCPEESGMMGGHGHGMMGGMMGEPDREMMLESPRMDIVKSLNLTDEQRATVNKLSDELKHKNWALLGEIMDESAKLRDLYEADKRDPDAISKEYQAIFDLKRQMIEAMLTTQNEAEDLLTLEQYLQFKEARKMQQMHRHPMH